MKQRTPTFAANWKMNHLVRETDAYVAGLSSQLADAPSASYEVIVCPPATHLVTLGARLSKTSFKMGAQNCGTAKSGAFTGEISPVVLTEVGCAYVILGHSERRHVYGEDDALVLSRTKSALGEGLTVLLCVGEVLAERKSGKTFERVEKQLSILKDSGFPVSGWSHLIVAYEPVWAIGTGENATPAQAQEVHAFIRGWLVKNAPAGDAEKIRILYGGSVKPENASQLMHEKDVDGFLVGGASLDPVAFAGVIRNGLKSVS